MIFSIAVYMQGGATIEHLENTPITRVQDLYSRVVKHSREMKRRMKE